MWGKVVEFVKGLFGGKGSTQIGSRNVSTNVTKNVTVSAGQDASHVTVAEQVYVTHAAPSTPPPAFEPKPEEVEILTRLQDSVNKTLHLVRIDSVAGYVVLIDGRELANPHSEVEACFAYIEAVHRLRDNNLLVNDSGEGELFHLSSAGRELAKKHRGKCVGCGRSMENVGKDPKQPPVWVCKNSRCLRSVWHRDTKCSTCGKPPAEITDGGVGFTSFRCEDGHLFTTVPKPGRP